MVGNKQALTFCILRLLVAHVFMAGLSPRCGAGVRTGYQGSRATYGEATKETELGRKRLLAAPTTIGDVLITPRCVVHRVPT